MCLGMANGYRKPTDKKDRTYAELKRTHFPENNSNTELTRDDVLRAMECFCSSRYDACETCPYEKHVFKQNGTGGCSNQLVRDALVLIKQDQAEKEAMLQHIKCLETETERLKQDLDATIAGQETLQIALSEKTAENERLNKLLETRHKVFETKCEELEIAKVEAIKEFAERLKKQKQSICAGHGMTMYAVSELNIDNLVKEMAGNG